MTQRAPLTGLGPVICDLRQQRGIKKAQLARMVGCHHKHVEYVENGRRNPSPELLWRIARALDTTPRELKEAARNTASAAA